MMASNYLDEFVLNFDLNQLTTQENVQASQKYDRLRKSTSWLKSKIISTDFVIQKYQSIKDDYEQSVKAHSVTKEELKQVCINYKDASEKCILLEKENKTLIANQEVLKERLIDAENKYHALLSHTNQLQMLVKQLENEKDALTVEKELNKCSISPEIIALQNEKDSMLKDLRALKGVILDKKKVNKRHVKLIKKYEKKIKTKGSKILCTSEESCDEIDNYGDIMPHIETKLSEVANDGDYSDGEVSVDTGRGSSRANSHDKYIRSPDYVATLENMLKYKNKDNIQQVDAASSPITVFPSTSVATSPIIFDHSEALIEDQYEDYTDCIDDAEYIIDDMPLISEEINALVEQEKLSDCGSPVPELSEIIDGGTIPLNKYEYIIVKEADMNTSDKSLFIEAMNPGEDNEFHNGSLVEEQFPGYVCETGNTLMVNENIEYIDTCTSPITIEHDIRQFIDKGINTEEQHEINKSCVDIGTCTDIGKQSENEVSKNSVEFSEIITSTKKRLVDVSTNTNLISIEKPRAVNIANNVLSKKQKKISLLFDEPLPKLDTISMSVNNERCSVLKTKSTNKKAELTTQEKVCLESNSSKELQFESSNDAEVQNILNVMKLHHNLISPISQTPSDFEYLKLLPEMNSKLTKILTFIENMCTMPNQLRNNDSTLQNSMEDTSFEDDPELEISSRKRISDHEKLKVDRNSNRVIELDTRQPVCENTSFECPNMGNDQRLHDILPKTSKSDTAANIQFSNSDKNILAAGEKKKHQLQQQIENSLELNKMCNNNINNCYETVVMEENINNGKDQQSIVNCYEVTENCESNLNINTDCVTRNISENSTTHPIVNSTKTKKKSKLEKFRQKLLPTCKIKKDINMNKHLSNVIVKPQNINSSPSLHQKIAFDNAVKVMAELRSNQESQEKKKPLKPLIRDTNMDSKSCNVNSSPSKIVELNILSTRSRTRRLSKKEELTENSGDIIDIEKSPVNRRLRKRPADTELDSLCNTSKRILRSSNISQVTDGKVLQEVQNGSIPEQLNKHSDNFNLQNNNCAPQGCHVVGTKSDTTIEKSIRRMKPVIELSECLADNANVVSIVPGSISYLDVNKNIEPKKLQQSNTNITCDTSKCAELNQKNFEQSDHGIVNPTVTHTDPIVKHSDKIANISQEESGDLSRIGNNDLDSTNITHSDQRKEHSKQKRKQDSPRASIEENKHTNSSITISLEQKLREEANIGPKNPIVQLIPLNNDVINSENNIVNYSDLDLYTEDSNAGEKMPKSPLTERNWKENILCAALDRYGVISVKYVAKKVPDAVTLKICQKIEENITNIIASSRTEQKSKMNDLVSSIQNFKTKQILAGLMKYLKDPTRKNELFNKIVNGPAPPMTKSEVILLYVIESLNGSLPGFINRLWSNMEHALFQLNRSPDFDVIESMSHFYAVLCRYFRNKSRLRCFMLDAMYCLQFKAVPLIRQCLDVCPGVLPNAHERMAKTSLVTCLVYLLHFYKCQDKFNRAQDIRNILNRKYQYQFSEWNETMILEIFRKAIMDLRGTQNDKKMLRVALIILCKRHGAKWCQLNIIQNMLLPIIEKKDVPDRIKQFCVLMLGPLLKPFPADRKAQCEIVINQLLQMLKQNDSQEMKEVIYSSLIFMNKHDPDRVVQELLSWNPERVSSEFEEILNDYVMEKPLALWKKLVTRKPSQCT